MSDFWMRPVDMVITDPLGPTHYPVTTRFWRGIRGWPQVRGTGTVRRACDWRKPASPHGHLFSLAPSCQACTDYLWHLRRLGKMGASASSP